MREAHSPPSAANPRSSSAHKSTLPQVSSADASAALALCQDTLLGALSGHGIGLDSILELTQCPDVASFSLSQCPARQ